MKLDQMSDILLAPAPELQVSPWLFFAAISVVLLIVLFIFLWKKFNQPLAKLKRDLKQDNIQPRDAAHSLAHLLAKNKNSKMSRQVDQLRFQRQAPAIEQLISIIDMLKHEP